MKKLVLMLAVAFSMTMFSCGNKAENAEAPAEEAAVVEEVVAAPVEEVAAEGADTVVVAEGEVVAAEEAPAAPAAE